MKLNETLEKVVRINLKNNKIPMLVGEPGIGKTSWIKALADSMGTKAFTMCCNQLGDKTDITGVRSDKDEETGKYKQIFFPHIIVYEAIKYAAAHPQETPLLFMDEINRSGNPDVTSALLSIPTERNIGYEALPDNLKVIMAGNDKGNVTSLDSASLTRMVLYHTTPDLDTYFAVNPNLYPAIKAVLEEHPDFLLCTEVVKIETKKEESSEEAGNEDFVSDFNDFDLEGEKMVQFANPRTISGLSDTLNDLSKEEILAFLQNTCENEDGETVSMLQELVEAHTGRTRFSIALLAKMAEEMLKMPVANTAVATVVKPIVWDTLRAAVDRTALQNTVNNMSEEDRSKCLVYALYDSEDNTDVLSILSAVTNSLTQEDMKTIMNLSVSNALDDKNVKTFLNSGSAISQMLNVVLSI